MSVNHPLVNISIQPIELCKLLKIANMVSGGGEAKIVISEGYVLLNDEVEFQKRKKVYHNDIVEFNGDIVQVNHVSSTVSSVKKDQTSSSIKNSKKTAKNNKASQNVVSIETPSEITQRKRKPISF